ncbi:phosphoethanolamine--lipid A transferase EptA [Capnocytophaga canis]|uniref:phosphoethanolamine--lipid A transferase EptA n=1 Tax=Capnocytophaga canis TaxID=1848903 RepID=UPI003858D419
MLKKLINNITLYRFVLIISILNFIFFHYGFFSFVFQNIDYHSFNGILLVISLFILMVVANFFAFYLILFLLRAIGKFLLAITFILSAIAVYFINTYSIIVDESMIGNLLNTDYEESSSFFSVKLILYLLVLGIIPSIYILKSRVTYPSVKKFFKNLGAILLVILILVVINAKNILWIDKNSKYLGGLAMPWSYSVNTILYYVHKAQENRQEILLPDATIKNKEKSVMVLVIGESARSENFSLYGYKKNTNPLLSKTENVFHFNANSCATYTTAAVKCILEHQDTGDLYEILPNYLNRSGVEVVWRTTNSGEPPVHIDKYFTGSALRQNCEEKNCDYDEVLLSGLKEQISKSDKDKILIILHTSTSHGPTYNKKYPAEFEVFKPVCNSVELGNCSHEELINAYDNTIVYTDYMLHKIIGDLKELEDYKTALLYVSDHGESLGEKNLYMHGLPMSIAPKEQYEIPFIVWKSADSKSIKSLKDVTQHHVFHSVLKFLDVESPIYNEELSIFAD